MISQQSAKETEEQQFNIHEVAHEGREAFLSFAVIMLDFHRWLKVLQTNLPDHAQALKAKLSMMKWKMVIESISAWFRDHEAVTE